MSAAISSVETCVASSAGAVGERPTTAFGTAQEGRLLVVAEAIGLRAQTSGAAHRAVQAFSSFAGSAPESSEEARSALERAFQAANAAVSSEDAEHGIAAAPDAVTMAALVLVGSEAVVAHAGNSRCYRARGGSVAVLTRDHSAVAELQEAAANEAVAPAVDPFHLHHRNLLTRALGLGRSMMPAITVRSARPGDRFMLCTAAVWSELPSQELHEVLGQVRSAAEAVGMLRARLGPRRRAYDVVIADLGGHAPHGSSAA